MSNYISTSSRDEFSSLRVPLPDKFAGDRSKFRGFLNQCQLYFNMQPHHFPVDSVKTGFIITLLQGEALDWVSPLLEKNDPILNLYSEFIAQLKTIFEESDRVTTAEIALDKLYQNSLSASAYAAKFQSISSDTEWNEPALMFKFRKGLKSVIKDEIAKWGRQETLKDLISLAIRIDTRYSERVAEKAIEKPQFHFSSNKFNNYNSNRTTHEDNAMQTTALIDSGASENFMDFNFATSNNIEIITLSTPQKVETVDGTQPTSGLIKHKTSKLEIHTDLNHKELIDFYLIKSAHSPVILGFPWLAKHNPAINWSSSNMLFKSDYCQTSCINPQHLNVIFKPPNSENDNESDPDSEADTDSGSDTSSVNSADSEFLSASESTDLDSESRHQHSPPNSNPIPQTAHLNSKNQAAQQQNLPSSSKTSICNSTPPKSVNKYNIPVDYFVLNPKNKVVFPNKSNKENETITTKPNTKPTFIPNKVTTKLTPKPRFNRHLLNSNTPPVIETPEPISQQKPAPSIYSTPEPNQTIKK
ncbi:Retrotransposon-like protein 1 [Smittium culicis]|uniref:Retrotransposon-like protein 1 n=1 Tax=Smittium culicis TaxID=133412 RepID=A0A1R1XYF1_9FUNG|nr:Retrotransposon-like protein 1 [Smittium culicis]